MKRLLLQTLPWLITAVALYFAFRGVDLGLLVDHLTEIVPGWALLALVLTALSYLLRAWRWVGLFPERVLTYGASLRVLVLGFFMNNVLPARAGEFVRAHMGARVTGEKRTLVLATIAGERLVDGLTISLMFVVFAIGLGSSGGLGDSGLSRNLQYVALLFGLVALAVILTLALRDPLFRLANRVAGRIDNRASDYTFDRFQVFVNGLEPIIARKKLPRTVLLSAAIWGVEYLVYLSVCHAFGAELGPAQYVLLLVAVNFSSLIPAAPGGLGVIEAVGSAVLISVGVPQEQALLIVILQHAIQYLVVGVPGAWIMLTWRDQLAKLRQESQSA